MNIHQVAPIPSNLANDMCIDIHKIEAICGKLDICRNLVSVIVNVFQKITSFRNMVFMRKTIITIF
jgi:hypothetical protein